MRYVSILLSSSNLLFLSSIYKQNYVCTYVHMYIHVLDVPFIQYWQLLTTYTCHTYNIIYTHVHNTHTYVRIHVHTYVHT